MKEKQDAEWQAESLRLEEEMEKARVRAWIYENGNQDQEMTFKMEEQKQEKIVYHQQITKHSEINQHGDRTNAGVQNVYSSIPRESYDQKLQRAFRQAPRANPGEAAIANSEKAVEDNEMGKMLCQLVKPSTVRSNRRYRRIRWEHFAIFLFQVSVLRGGGEENC